MAVEQGATDGGAHELRLEGARLVVSVVALGGIVLAAVVSAFLLGRWVESRSRPGPAMGSDQGGPLAGLASPAPPLDAEEDLTYFDDARGGEQQAEPGRELPPAPRGPEPAGDGGAGGDGAFFVQVFAGRDRPSADELVRRLRSEGFRVRVVTEREGTGALYKVRVGGFDSEPGARQAMEALKGKGFSGAWVTRAD